MSETQPTNTVLINAIAHEVNGPLSYEEIVTLAGQSGTPTVAWYSASGRGTLYPRDVLAHPAGAKISVAHTVHA